MFLLGSIKGRVSRRCLLAVLIASLSGSKALAEDSKLAGAWVLVEGKRQITAQGHQEEAPLPAWDENRPYLIINPDGTFHMIEGTAASYLGKLRMERDRLELPGDSGKHFEVKESEYTEDFSKLLLGFSDEGQDQHSTLSFEARLMPNGMIFFRNTRPTLGEGHEVVTGTLRHFRGRGLGEQPNLKREFRGHVGSVKAVAYSPDGQYVLSGGLDKTVRLWDIETGQEVRRFSGHQRSISGVEFSPDGLFVVSGSYEPMSSRSGDDYSVRIWEIKTGRQTQRIRAYDYVKSVDFSPDGHYVLVSGHGKGDQPYARSWDVRTGKLNHDYVQETGGVVLGAFYSPDGRNTLTAIRSISGESFCLADAQEGRHLRCFGQAGEMIESVSFSPDGSHFLSAGQGGFIREWDSQTGSEVRHLQIPSSNCSRAEYLRDANLIFGICGHTHLHFWNLETGLEIRRFQAHHEVITDLAISPDGRRVVSASLDGTLRLWIVPE